MASGPIYKREIVVLKATELEFKSPGSNEGRLYSIEYYKPGNRTRKRAVFYIKSGETKYHADNEVLANHMYLMLGIRSALGYRVMARSKAELRYLFPDLTANGCNLIGSKVIKNLKPVQNPRKTCRSEDVKKGFVADAFLANWDAGKCGPRANLFYNQNGVTRLDFGGALLYRARGEPKRDRFNGNVNELETFKEKKIYSKVTDQDIMDQIDIVLNVFSEDVIHNLVDLYGLGRWRLAEKLIARRNYLVDTREALSYWHV